MDIVKAASVYAYMDERRYIETLINEIKTAIEVGGKVGSATITIPRRHLPSVKSLLEADLEDLTAKIEAL